MTLLQNNARYTLEYPSDWTVTRNATLPEVGYDMLGTILRYPALDDGTTLTDAAIHISVGSACPSLANAETTGPATKATVGGREWDKVSRDGVGAGNRYRGDTYTRTEGGLCYAISTLLHSCNLGPDCGENHSKPFDEQRMYALFDSILSTFAFRQ